MRSIQTNTMIFMSDRLSVAFSFSRRAHLLTTCKAGGGIPPVGQARALFTKRLSAAFPEGAGNVASEHSLCSRLYILHYQQNDEVAYCHPIPPSACENLPPSACENLPPAAFTQLWVSHFRRHPFSLFNRETERKDGENKWQSIIWKQK